MESWLVADIVSQSWQSGELIEERASAIRSSGPKHFQKLTITKLNQQKDSILQGPLLNCMQTLLVIKSRYALPLIRKMSQPTFRNDYQTCSLLKLCLEIGKNAYLVAKSASIQPRMSSWQTSAKLWHEFLVSKFARCRSPVFSGFTEAIDGATCGPA